MKTTTRFCPTTRHNVSALSVLFLCVIFVTFSHAADDPPEFIAAALKRRAEIPLGGDFKPDPKAPVFVAVGHGGRILLSRDDGQTWKQVFWGHAGSDHGPWATKAIAYTNGVFVVPIGWGAPTAWLASEDGVNWRHLTSGQTKLKGIKDADGDPTVMPGTWGIAGGKGVFVTGGYMEMAATPDFGKTITTFSLRSFKDDPRPRKLVTHHVGPIYCGDASGRFLALGNDRAQQNPVFGNLWSSDDLGKTWTWLEPELLNKKCDGYSGIVSNGERVVIADKSGANVFVSGDAGDTWNGPFSTGIERASLSLVGREFWLISSKAARASADGRTWRDLPQGIPSGKIVASPDGTLISIDRQRFNILRSTDGGQSWSQVYSFQPETEHVHGAQGLRDIVFGYATPG
ncbi:MAG: exo-alpha-sialidase, partial [Planctomycetaceae bacterium]|nr:exo-alpha-sialidase [Planctomycetaceae bacterium]